MAKGSTSLYLVHTNYFLIESGNSVTIINLFGSIQIDGSVVNSQFILSEEGDGSVLKEQKDNFVKHLCTIDLLLFSLDQLCQLSNTIDLAFIALEDACEGGSTSLKLGHFFGVANLSDLGCILPFGHLSL